MAESMSKKGGYGGGGTDKEENLEEKNNASLREETEVEKMMRESMVERLYKRYLQRGVGGRARDTQEEEDHQECGEKEVVVLGMV